MWGGDPPKNKICGGFPKKMCEGGVGEKIKLVGRGQRNKIKICEEGQANFSAPPPQDLKWNSLKATTSGPHQFSLHC